MDRAQRKPQIAGFTTIELIVTMIIIGILAAVALPRMSLLSGFDEVGYRDQVIAALEFARKSAVAQRRNVQVTLAGNALTFSIAQDIPEGAAATNYNRSLILPGSSTNQISPRGNTALTGPATLVFNPLGQASAASYVYTVTGNASTTVTVDPGSGYVG